ncbi:hypothetical protein HDV03_003761 [Kappamyces sp. JEL0829]|nr:hypothetical protein HDV03_003761 [Kappamyces sp. JEL0829]
MFTATDSYLAVPVCFVSLMATLAIIPIVRQRLVFGTGVSRLIALAAVISNLVTEVLSISGVLLGSFSDYDYVGECLGRVAGVFVNVNILTIALLNCYSLRVYRVFDRRITTAVTDRWERTIYCLFFLLTTWNVVDQVHFIALGYAPQWLGLMASSGTLVWSSFVVVYDFVQCLWLTSVVYHFKFKRDQKTGVSIQKMYYSIVYYNILAIGFDWLAIGLYVADVIRSTSSGFYYGLQLAAGSVSGFHICILLIITGKLATLVVYHENDTQLVVTTLSSQRPSTNAR